MPNTNLVGAHISIALGLHLIFERAESINCGSVQIFSKSSRTLFGKQIREQEIQVFKKRREDSSVKAIVVHAGYLINLCKPCDKSGNSSAQASLQHELERCLLLEIPHLIVHPGSHVGAGEEAGIKNIAFNINKALENTQKTIILLETMAGQGTSIGYKFEHLKEIRELCNQKDRVQFCLDTCHIFAAGYKLDNKESYHETIEEFDKILGLENLKCVHVNNSKTDLGSRVDRHAPIKEGKIPLEIFELLMQDKRLSNIPKILETPTDDQMLLWKEEIKLLNSFIK